MKTKDGGRVLGTSDRDTDHLVVCFVPKSHLRTNDFHEARDKILETYKIE